MEFEEIFETIEAGDDFHARELLGANPAAMTARNAQGVSLLSTAIYADLPGIVELILETEPELDVYEAAALGEEGRVAELLDANPDLLTTYSPDGFTVLHLATFFGHGSLVDSLLARGAPVDALAESEFAKVTPLQSAAAGRHTEIARRLIDAGANVNVRSPDMGFTPLHAAAHNGNVELVRLLLERGADPHATTEADRSARDLAESHEGVLALLPKAN